MCRMYRMKKLGLLSMVIGIIFLVSCVPYRNITKVQKDNSPVIVKLKIEGVDSVKVEETDKVSRAIEIPYEKGEYSGFTFVEGSVAFMKIWGGLTDADAMYIWNDLCILKNRGIKNVELYINSGGGSAFSGLSVADQVSKFIKTGGKVTAYASGIIASATVPIFAVCSKRYATAGTIFMVHEASIFKYFSQESRSDIKAQNKLMELLENNYLNKLAKHTKLSVEEWRDFSKDTTWFSVEQAKEWGLVDEIQ